MKVSINRGVEMAQEESILDISIMAIARILESGKKRRNAWCRRPDLNRHSPFEPRDFKSVF